MENYANQSMNATRRMDVHIKKECPVLKNKRDRFEMECVDDKILIKTECTEEITLRKWLVIKEDE